MRPRRGKRDFAAAPGPGGLPVPPPDKRLTFGTKTTDDGRPVDASAGSSWEPDAAPDRLSVLPGTR